MKLSELKGRGVVSLDDAQKLGSVADLLLDLPNQRATGLQIKLAGLFSGHRLLPWQAIHAIGQNAVTVASLDALKEGTELPQLQADARSAAVIGSRVMTVGGTEVGTIADLEIHAQTGAVTGYILGANLLDRIQHHEHLVLPTDGTSMGPDLIVVSDSTR